MLAKKLANKYAAAMGFLAVFGLLHIVHIGQGQVEPNGGEGLAHSLNNNTVRIELSAATRHEQHVELSFLVSSATTNTEVRSIATGLRGMVWGSLDDGGVEVLIVGEQTQSVSLSSIIRKPHIQGSVPRSNPALLFDHEGIVGYHLTIRFELIPENQLGIVLVNLNTDVFQDAYLRLRGVDLVRSEVGVSSNKIFLVTLPSGNP